MMGGLEERVAALEAEVRWWRRLHVLTAARDGGGIDAGLDVRELRNEVRRGLWQRAREVSAEMRKERVEATRMIEWTGTNLDELRAFVAGKASLVLDGWILTVVHEGRTHTLHRGDWIERDPYTGRIQPSPGPDGYDEADQAAENYMNAVMR